MCIAGVLCMQLVCEHGDADVFVSALTTVLRVSCALHSVSGFARQFCIRALRIFRQILGFGCVSLRICMPNSQLC